MVDIFNEGYLVGAQFYDKEKMHDEASSKAKKNKKKKRKERMQAAKGRDKVDEPIQMHRLSQDEEGIVYKPCATDGSPNKVSPSPPIPERSIRASSRPVSIHPNVTMKDSNFPEKKKKKQKMKNQTSATTTEPQKINTPSTDSPPPKLVVNRRNQKSRPKKAIPDTPRSPNDDSEEDDT